MADKAQIKVDGLLQQTLRIGEFIISVLPGGGIYIGSSSGEAGAFKADLFEEAIRAFFSEHF